jgi:hypothetical protein
MSKPTAGQRGKTPAKVPAVRGSAASAAAVSSRRTVRSLRLEPAHEAGLGLLKVVLRKPLNRMVNEAVGEYIVKRTAEAEARMTGTLERLKAYRRRDPNFEQDLAAFIAAEARHGKNDPMEGVVYAVSRPVTLSGGTREAGSSKTGPALKAVRNLLRG